MGLGGVGFRLKCDITETSVDEGRLVIDRWVGCGLLIVVGGGWLLYLQVLEHGDHDGSTVVGEWIDRWMGSGLFVVGGWLLYLQVLEHGDHDGSTVVGELVRDVHVGRHYAHSVSRVQVVDDDGWVSHLEYLRINRIVM